MSFRYKLFFHIKNSLCLALLTACGSNDFSDLNAYILNVKAQPKDSIELLPEINIVETFIFNPEGLRDPFKPIDKTPQNKLAVFRVHSKTQKPRIQITFCEEINWRCYVPPCLL